MEPGEKKVHKGVFLLPNALTTGAMFAGFYSIISGINGHFVAGAVAVVIAGLLDGLDGRVARLTNTQSDFGVQYDSLSDLISFGLAPALLAFNWSLASMSEISPFAGKLGWLAAFLFAACAALRFHPGQKLFPGPGFTGGRRHPCSDHLVFCRPGNLGRIGALADVV